MNPIYVDVDGTLLSREHDVMFAHKIAEVGLADAIAWYDSAYQDRLSINYELIAEIYALKAMGVHFVIYTNRGVNQVEMTKRNLGRYWHLFDDHIFTEGKKSKMYVDGTLWDNEARYSKNAKALRLISFG